MAAHDVVGCGGGCATNGTAASHPVYPTSRTASHNHTGTVSSACIGCEQAGGESGRLEQLSVTVRVGRHGCGERWVWQCV